MIYAIVNTMYKAMAMFVNPFLPFSYRVRTDTLFLTIVS